MLQYVNHLKTNIH